MRVLVTGAFGNVGRSLLLALAGRGHAVVAADRASRAAFRAARAFPGVKVRWGDLTDPVQVAGLVVGVDAVVHLAAVIPPASERRPEVARRVNVEGTRNLVEALRAVNPGALFVLASSVSVHGPAAASSTPLRASDPACPTDHYSGHKLEAEALVRASGLPFCILRLNAAMPLKLAQFDPLMFDVSLDSPLEFVHTRDAGLAFANALDAPEARGRVLLIAGGERCRTRYREFFTELLGALGVGMLPDDAFGDRPFYTGWMDTADSQALLRYQR
ncbi:MAG TPA: NAD(P)-dependent oxidoreductase, partial [Deinococcales bacterium]|nr:NAD(P)-dependent oxidoreductase [Deinococcales bacterium]